jgi:cytochrome P450
VLVIFEVPGITPADRDRVKRWCDDFSIVALNFYSKITDVQLQAGCDIVSALGAYFSDQIAARRDQAGSDLLSYLVAAEEAGACARA